MTWRLRLLDEEGDEVGWATLDPHEFWVDDNLSDARQVESMLKQVGSRTVVSAPTEWTYDEGKYVPEMSTQLGVDDRPNEERLEECALGITFEDRVADYELLEE